MSRKSPAKPNFSFIHETVPHGNLRFHLGLHNIISDISRIDRISSHWHEEYELLKITAGHSEIHINNRSFTVNPGDIVFINSEEVHCALTLPGKEFNFYAIDFGLELISSYGNDDIQQSYIKPQLSGELRFRDIFRINDPGWEELSASMDHIYNLYQENIQQNELLIKADLLRIWHYLSLYPETEFVSRTGDENKISLTKSILNFIQQHYREALSLKQMADFLHMSEGQFCRFFKSQVNVTAIEYLNHCRIGAACDLLESSQLTVSSIAIECGYNNISYFNRIFRKYMHCTPKEYRKKFLSKNT